MRVDRENGYFVTNPPISGLDTTVVTVISISRVPAVEGESPCPATRNGYPHRSANTVAPNWAEKCDHRPSLVPGVRQAARTLRAMARTLIWSSSWSGFGESRTTSRTMAPSTTPKSAATA